MKYYWLKLAEVLSRLFPRRVAYGIARRMADLYVLFDKRGRKCVISNLKQIQANSGRGAVPARAPFTGARDFLNFAKYLVDFFKVPPLRPSAHGAHRALRQSTGGTGRLLEHGKGVIFVSAHLGNWELGRQRWQRWGQVQMRSRSGCPMRSSTASTSTRMSRGVRPIPLAAPPASVSPRCGATKLLR